MFSFIDFFFVFQVSKLLPSFVADHCRDNLGAAAGGALEDQRFSASSSYDEASVGPEEARYVFF